ILAAVIALIPEVRDPSLRAQLGRVASQLGLQAPLPRLYPIRVPNRSNRWQPLYELSDLVLEGFGVRFDPRKFLRAPGFVMDTWRVWQDLVGLGLRIGSPPGQVRLQSRSHLGIG